MSRSESHESSKLSRRSLLRLGGMVALLSACRPTRQPLMEETTSQSPIETPSMDASPVKGIAAGRYHSIALHHDGQIHSWGGNRSGQLGDGTFENTTLPIKTQMGNAKKIATFDRFSMALSNNATVWTWGPNEGQLGYKSDSAAINSPQEIPDLRDIVGITAGAFHGLAWTKSGSLWSWGVAWGAQELSDLATDPSMIDDYREILGGGTDTGGVRGLEIPHPYPILDLPNVVLVETGLEHTLALDENGYLWAWGTNSSGELGDGSRVDKLQPVKINTPTKLISIAAGAGFSAGLRQNGTLFFWGEPLGRPRRQGILKPSPVESLNGVVAIAAGFGHILALRNDGTVWAWGWNVSGQVGNGTQEDQLAPIRVNGLKDIVAVAAGVTHSLAINSDGQLWAWGSNEFGQLGDGTMQERLFPTQVNWPTV